MRKNFAICHGCCWRPNEYVSGSPTHCDVGGCCPYLHRVSDQKKKRITWIGYILGTPNLIERPLFKKISRYIGTYSWRFLKVQNCFDDTLKSSTKILKKGNQDQQREKIMTFNPILCTYLIWYFFFLIRSDSLYFLIKRSYQNST